MSDVEKKLVREWRSLPARQRRAIVRVLDDEAISGRFNADFYAAERQRHPELDFYSRMASDHRRRGDAADVARRLLAALGKGQAK